MREIIFFAVLAFLLGALLGVLLVINVDKRLNVRFSEQLLVEEGRVSGHFEFEDLYYAWTVRIDTARTDSLNEWRFRQFGEVK